MREAIELTRNRRLVGRSDAKRDKGKGGRGRSGEMGRGARRRGFIYVNGVTCPRH